AERQSRTVPKSYKSAIVLIPPESVWEPIQKVRSLYDRKIGRWMPHVTLIYPFAPEERFTELLPSVATACRRMTPFRVRLATFRWFVHRGGSATIWLEPEPSERVAAIEAELERELVGYDDQSRRFGRFTPHLSVGQVPAKDVQAVVNSLQAEWEPTEFLLDRIALICRSDTGPFQVRFWSPLGN
ncbi:MAG TPA: 2'-5' RNA ligase family protein, partial [Planctomycetaceae bacterium]|nr:2'-5' RNA ligase family protein [Planctomycetaceae bacterium]